MSVQYMLMVSQDKALLECHTNAFDATIEAIARIKSRLFHTVATSLSRELDVEVAFTKEAVERRYKYLIGTDENSPVVDPFVTNDEFEQQARQRQVVKQAEALDREAKEAEELAKAEQKKIEQALEVKRQAEAEVAKAEAVLKEISKTSKAKMEAAARKRADADRATPNPLETPKKKKKTPAKLKLHTPVGFNTVGDDESDTPLSPSPLGGRQDAKKNLGVDPKDPRRHLTVNELEALCGVHGLLKTGPKAVLMKRLRDYDDRMSVEHLQNKLNENGMSPAGEKPALLDRLAFLDAQKSNWGRRISLVTEEDISPIRSPHTPTKMTLPSQNATPKSATFPNNTSLAAPAKRNLSDDPFDDRTSNKRVCAKQSTGQESLITPREENFEKN
jgi:hypothetical protein